MRIKLREIDTGEIIIDVSAESMLVCISKVIGQVRIFQGEDEWECLPELLEGLAELARDERTYWDRANNFWLEREGYSE